MSLVGSLQDLGLGDILQIVSLSRKSGLLLLRSDAGEGRIVVRDGQVCAAFEKGEPEDLRGLLVSAGFVSDEEFGRAVEVQRRRGVPLPEAVVEMTTLTRESLDSLRREHVERTVLQMFTWRTGEFSFEVRGEIDERDQELLLPSGINPQYLTMEATRLGDESRLGPAAGSVPAEESRGPAGADGAPADAGDAGADAEADVAEPVFSGEDLAGLSEPVSGEPPTGAPGAEPARAAGPVPEPAAAVRPEAPAAADGAADAHETLALAAARAQDETASGRGLVVLDPELPLLEWVKDSLEGVFARVHIFQRTEGAITRIRQYLSRGRVPVVLMSPHAPGHELSGVKDAGDLIRRFRTQAPRMPILALCVRGEETRNADAADAIVTRPATSEIADPAGWPRHARAAHTLREHLRPWALPDESDGEAIAMRALSPSLQRVKEVSDRLQDPSQRGDVLSLVLEFAAETFPRVAMFMLRDDEAIGIAQVGLATTGGPDDDAFRELAVDLSAARRFQAVVESREPLRAEPRNADDLGLAIRLGADAETPGYVAPILGGEGVVALLYGDMLPGRELPRDTTALEIVLHQAGLALDRALLSRALEAVRGSASAAD